LNEAVRTLSEVLGGPRIADAWINASYLHVEGLHKAYEAARRNVYGGRRMSEVDFGVGEEGVSAAEYVERFRREALERLGGRLRAIVAFGSRTAGSL